MLICEVGKIKKLIILFIFAWEILGYGTEQGDITYEVRAGIQVNIVLDNDKESLLDNKLRYLPHL